MLQVGCDRVERGFCEHLIVLEVASRARFDNHVYDVMSFALHVGIVCNLSRPYESLRSARQSLGKKDRAMPPFVTAH